MNIVEVFRATIQIGQFELEAYTANKKDKQGNWINYLSGKGMAGAIELSNRTTIESELSKELKAKLGKNFSCIEGKYRTSRGGMIKVNLWGTADASKYWGYHASKGNQQAISLAIALMSASIDIMVNDAFEREYQRGDAEKLVCRILDQPAPWEQLYEAEFCDRVFKWFGAQFYWEFAYCFLTPMEVCKLNELNPAIKGDRKHRIHSYLEPNTRKRLEPHVLQLIAICNASEDKEQFLNGYRRHFNKANQLKLAI